MKKIAYGITGLLGLFVTYIANAACIGLGEKVTIEWWEVHPAKAIFLPLLTLIIGLVAVLIEWEDE